MGLPDQSSPALSGRTPARDYVVLYDSPRTRVVRLHGGGVDDLAGVIWKESLGPDSAHRQQHELAILGRLAKVRGVPKVVQASGGGSGFAVRDERGRPLAAVLADPARTGRGVADGDQVIELVGLLVDLVKVLSEVHAAGVIHKDINPSNIVVTEPGGHPLLIDWDLASTFAEERPAFAHETRMAGTPQYLAPEQTGRTSYSIDQRTDLYALGATIYECCTGAPPFGVGDVLSLVHDHLARIPEPVDLVNPVVPHPLAAVVARLLEKAPDRRYQSATGLLHDLGRIQDDLRAGRPEMFELGSRDVPVRITPPSRLIGREHEVSVLQDAFERCFTADRRLLLVGGAPGVGKTSLVDELRPLTAARDGWFVQGKFDQFCRDRVDDAVSRAVGNLARLLLAEPEAQLAALRQQLLPKLGADAGILAAIVPELSPVLEVEPACVSDGDVQQLSTRLVRAGVRLVQEVASPRRPLVMFLDDLQWAGDVPVSFVDAMATGGGPPGFLLVAAYRDGEVTSAHPLAASFERWARLGREPIRLGLRDLSKRDVRGMLAQMLRLDQGDAAAAELAQIIIPRTGGNPYETIELVDALYREGLLCPGERGWVWQRDALQRYLPLDCAREDLSVARIDALPADSAAVLDTLACMGGEVGLDLLGSVCDLDPVGLSQALDPCMSEGLLLAVQDNPTTTATRTGSATASVRFRHDRLREAAYTRKEPTERRRQHLDVARRLYTDPRLQSEAAEHYLAAASEVTDPQEREVVAHLFACTATAIRLVNQLSAERFLAAGLELVTGLDDPRTQALTTRLMIERHAALFNLARFDEADQLYRSLQARRPDPVTLAAATGVQIVSINHRARPAEAVALALDGLSAIGFGPPPEEDLDVVNRSGLAALRAWLIAGPQAGEQDRPEADDPRVRAAAVLIERAVPAAWYCNHPLMPWLMFLSHRLWVEHGPCAALLSCFGGVGMTGINLCGDYSLGYTANRRVLAVGQARGWEPDTSQLRNTHTNFGIPYFEPIENVIEEALIARERLLRCGELQYASFTYVATLWAALDCAPTLDAVQTELNSAMTFWTNTGYLSKVLSYTGYRQLLASLRGQTDRTGAPSECRGSLQQMGNRSGY